MAINADKSDVIIPFVYTDDKTGDKYFIRYHYYEGVPSVSFSNDQEEWIQVPANLFAEVTDFLRAKGVIYENSKNDEPKMMNQKPKKAEKFGHNIVVRNSDDESDDESDEDLPLPEIRSSEEQIEQPNNEEQAYNPEPLKVAETEPLQSFSGMEELVDKTAVSSGNSNEKETNTGEEVDRPVIRSETDAALLRKKNAKKKIKRL